MSKIYMDIESTEEENDSRDYYGYRMENYPLFLLIYLHYEDNDFTLETKPFGKQEIKLKPHQVPKILRHLYDDGKAAEFYLTSSIDYTDKEFEYWFYQCENYVL